MLAVYRLLFHESLTYGMKKTFCNVNRSSVMRAAYVRMRKNLNLLKNVTVLKNDNYSTKNLLYVSFRLC